MKALISTLILLFALSIPGITTAQEDSIDTYVVPLEGGGVLIKYGIPILVQYCGQAIVLMIPTKDGNITSFEGDAISHKWRTLKGKVIWYELAGPIGVDCDAPGAPGKKKFHRKNG